MLSVTDVKNYIRATDDDTDMVLSLMDASESYMEGAVDNYSAKYAHSGNNWKSKADLARKMLIADWYENRTPTERPVSPAVRLLITQLQLEGVVYENS